MIREFFSDSSGALNPDASSTSLTCGRESWRVKDMCSIRHVKHRRKTSTANKTTCAALVLGNRRAVNSVSIFDMLAAANCRARPANKLSTNDSSILMSYGVSSWFLKVQPSAGCLWIEPRPERDALDPSERDACPRMRPRGRPLPRARRRPELRSRETSFSGVYSVACPLISSFIGSDSTRGVSTLPCATCCAEVFHGRLKSVGSKSSALRTEDIRSVSCVWVVGKAHPGTLRDIKKAKKSSLVQAHVRRRLRLFRAALWRLCCVLRLQGRY
jgi:hypothetical protein